MNSRSISKINVHNRSKRTASIKTQQRKTVFVDDDGSDASDVMYDDLEYVNPINIFKPVSVILTTKIDRNLNSKSGYEIRFNDGVMEGDGISINKAGDIITFKNEGSYRFELCGYAKSSNHADIRLVYHSDNSTKYWKSSGELVDDMKLLGIIPLKNNDGNFTISGSATILPIDTNQSIRVKLLPLLDENILLFKQCRLLIYRVA